MMQLKFLVKKFQIYFFLQKLLVLSTIVLSYMHEIPRNFPKNIA